MQKIFNKANDKFLLKSKRLIYDDVAERGLCSELKVFLLEQLADTKYSDYYFQRI